MTRWLVPGEPTFQVALEQEGDKCALTLSPVKGDKLYIAWLCPDGTLALACGLTEVDGIKTEGGFIVVTRR